MENKTVKELADKLGEAIKDSKEFLDYQTAKEKYDSDEELQKLIGEFNMAKMNVMTEMQKGEEKDDKKLAEYQEKMRAVYSDIFKNDLMTEFNTAKGQLEAMVNEIYGIINFYITGEDPNCTHDCSTCGGCH